MEEWTDCVNPCNTCEQRGRCEQRMLCRSGCDCKVGFLRNNEKICVPEAQCEDSRIPQCPENAVFMRCGNACAATCETPPSDRCPEECATGCFCAPGFLKRKDNRCVRPEHCQPNTPQQAKCPENAIFLKCGSSCAPTCDDPLTRDCPEKCVTGCFCKPGFLKREDEVCVRPSNCKIRQESEKKEPKCDENAVFIECGSLCPPTCESPLPNPCEEDCVTACYCKPGFLKNKEDKCVRPQQCNTTKTIDPRRTQNCPENSIFNDCGTACPSTCENPQPVRCTLQCVPGCVCRSGFLRRKDGRCVAPQACKTSLSTRKTCPADEEFLKCGPPCPETCESKTKNESLNNESCNTGCQEGCFCKKGLFRTADDACVPLDACKESEKNGTTPRPTTNQKCPLAEEELLECGPTCPDTCENNGTLTLNQCPVRCVNGCFCKKGLFRTNTGGCVPPFQCPPSQKKDELEVVATPVSWETGNTAIFMNVSAASTEDFGCPNNATECNTVCTNFGWLQGVCIGDRDEECRCLTF